MRAMIECHIYFDGNVLLDIQYACHADFKQLIELPRKFRAYFIMGNFLRCKTLKQHYDFDFVSIYYIKTLEWMR